MSRLLDSTINFELILKYVDSLKWVILILLIFLYYRKVLDRFIKRISFETNEISSSFFTAKFVNEINEAKDSSTTIDDLKSKLDSILKDNLVDEIKIKSISFMTKELDVREATARDVYFLTRQLSADELVELSRSALWGEQISALIGIKSHLNNGSSIIIKKPAIDLFITQALTSNNSRVRYRALQVVQVSAAPYEKHQVLIADLLKTEPNNVVRKLMQTILHQNQPH